MEKKNIKIIYFKIISFIFLLIQFKLNINFISSSNNNNKQILKIIEPSKKCHPLSSKTLYFTSKFRNYNIQRNTRVNNIILNNRKYFVTYYLNYQFKNYYYIFKEHGLLRSPFPYSNNNIFIDTLNIKYINKLRKNYPINKYQKIYRFIGTVNYFDKDILYKNYLNMKKIFDKDFNYMPETFYYPENKDIIFAKFKNYNFNIDNIWLIKPKNNYGGRGIYIFKSLEKIKENEFIITKYISNPNLIKKKKYDLRLYILITGLKPLIIYLNKEGLIRRAAEDYSLDTKSFNNKFIHLTNTDINRKNKDYIYPKNNYDENSNIWNINIYKNYLYKNNINFNNIWEKIKDIIIKTIISTMNDLINENERLNLNDRNFYYLLGFDILITDKFQPILLEVNYSPSMKINNKIDKPIKTNIFIDMLNIVGITPFFP